MTGVSLKVGLVVAAAALAGCTAEPHYPIEPGQTLGQGGVGVVQPRYAISSDRPAPPAQTQTSGPPPALSSDDGPPPRAAPSGSVETQPIGAPRTSASPSSSRYPPTYGADADLRGRQSQGLPLVRAAPPPALETPHEVQVQPFESVYDVAERTRTPIRAIIDLNGLRSPYTLTPGSVLRIPPPVVYTVREGDTLFGVARRFSIDPRSLANLNDLPLETHVRAGQRIALPSLVRDKGANPMAGGAPPEGLMAQGEPAGAPYAKPGQSATEYAHAAPSAKADSLAAAEPLPPRVQTPPASDAQVAGLGRGKFAWPVKGQVLSGFGPKGPGQRNDGVNIAATAGDSVKAAAAGTVVYAGSSIPAFGNLVLVKHPGGWATLYGNLGKITVKNNAQVAQGQEVGTAGMSGAVDRPQVHFEIRYAQNPRDKAKPYDPAGLLPGG